MNTFTDHRRGYTCHQETRLRADRAMTVCTTCARRTRPNVHRWNGPATLPPTWAINSME